jgi:hypothetical protein
VENRRKLWCIADGEILYADERVRGRARRPVRRRARVFDDRRRFLREIEILDNTLNRAENLSAPGAEEKRWGTDLRSSSRAVQNRHAQ